MNGSPIYSYSKFRRIARSHRQVRHACRVNMGNFRSERGPRQLYASTLNSPLLSMQVSTYPVRRRQPTARKSLAYSLQRLLFVHRDFFVSFAEIGPAYFSNPEPRTQNQSRCMIGLATGKYAAILIAGGGMLSLKKPAGGGMAGAR